MEKAKLQAVAKELNDLLGLDPAINHEAADAEISGKVAEAVGLLEKGDKLSADAIATLSELGHDDHLKRAGLLKAAKKVKASGERGPSLIAQVYNVWLGNKEINNKDLCALFPTMRAKTVTTYVSNWKRGNWIPKGI